MRQKVVLLVILFLVLSISFVSANDDSLSNIVNEATEESSNTEESSQGSESGGGISDHFRNHEGVTSDNMRYANNLAGPFVAMLGNLTGVILVVIGGGVFLVTALDLLAITIPFTRSFLVPAQAQQQGGMGGIGGMGGTANQVKQKRFLSDEALECIQLAEGGGQAQGGGTVGGIGGIGGMGGMGGMGSMGGMMGGMGGQQSEPPKTKSLVFSYLKKRMFFMVILFVAVVVLSSSVLVGTGINLGELVLRLVERINESIAGSF